MAQIYIESDNQLKKPEIIVPLIHSSKDEAGKDYKNNQSGKQETSVFGIKVPLIQINNIVIDFTNVHLFELKSTGVLPSVNMLVTDNYGLIESLDTPGIDNELVVQVLPPFDEAYKKINLVFYISNIKINNKVIQLTGIYKLPKLTDKQFKAFGKTNTYNLFKQVSKNTGLGFATNVTPNDQDARYVYCSNKSYKDMLETEIEYGGSKTEIYDWWIDFWDNINLVDVYERYNAVDQDKDMMVWVSCQTNEIDEGIKIEPKQITAVINNHPGTQNTELFASNIEIHNNSGIQYNKGTDKVYSIYDENNKEYEDYLIQDGDVKKDVFTNLEYAGELYGDYNYILQKQCHAAFLQKIDSESVKVTIKTPLLGLMRGHKVNLMWYRVDSLLESKLSVLKQHDLIEQNPDTQISMSDKETDETLGQGEGSFILDKKVSGQYLITGCTMKYENNEWYYTLTLNRPNSTNPKLIKEE